MFPQKFSLRYNLKLVQNDQQNDMHKSRTVIMISTAEPPMHTPRNLAYPTDVLHRH